MLTRKEKLLRWLYPARCPVCDGLLGRQERLICRACASDLHFLQEPLCFHCGKPLSGEEIEYCSDCRRKKHSYDRGFAPFSYRGQMQASMMRFKYGGRAEYARFYAAAMEGRGRRLLRQWKPEVLLPVPVHRKRLIRRGYNQAARLAQELSRLTGIPADCKALIRRKNTKAQKELNDVERRKNLEQAFALAPGYRPPKCLVLVDDIYTTGSTVDTLAALLKAAGAEQVYVACACISPGAS